MANLHKLSVQEGINAQGVGGKWTVNAVATHGGTSSTNTIHVDISGAGQIGVYAAGDIYFRFGTSGSSGTADDCERNNDLIIPGSTLTFLTVPRGLGNTIYFNHLGSAAVATRVVEV